MTISAFRIRTAIILLLLAAWAVCAGFKLYTHTVRDREKLLKRSRLIAWREADLPAPRGKILDRDGKVLAQDVFVCDLILDALPENRHARRRLLKCLQTHFPAFRPESKDQGYPAVLKKNLSAEEIRSCSRMFRDFPEIRTEGRFERELDPEPEIRERIGQTARNDRKERVGISGLEQQHDLTLSGKPGRIKVMLDRNGRWVYETLRVTRQPEGGQDLKLEQSRNELIRIPAGGEYESNEPHKP